MTGRIYLGGGGNLTQSRQFDTFFMKEIELRAESSASCLYVPVAMEDHKHEEALKWFMSGYGQFNRITMISDLTDKDKLALDYTAIYLGGGNTGRLIDKILESRFSDYLLKHYAEGRIIYGGSAGAIVLGKSILTAGNDERSLKNDQGLGILNDASVAVHFKEENLPELKKLAKEVGSKILAIPESAGLIWDGQKLIAIGELPSYEVYPDEDIKKI